MSGRYAVGSLRNKALTLTNRAQREMAKESPTRTALSQLQKKARALARTALAESKVDHAYELREDRRVVSKMIDLVEDLELSKPVHRPHGGHSVGGGEGGHSVGGGE